MGIWRLSNSYGYTMGLLVYDNKLYNLLCLNIFIIRMGYNINYIYITTD